MVEMFSRLRVISTRLCSEGLLLILISGDGSSGTFVAVDRGGTAGTGGGGSAGGGSLEGLLPTRLLRNASSRRFRGTGAPRETGWVPSVAIDGTTGEDGLQPAVDRRLACVPPPPPPLETTNGLGPLN